MFMVNTSPTAWMRCVRSSETIIPDPSKSRWRCGRVRWSKIASAEALIVRETVMFCSVMGSTRPADLRPEHRA